MCLLRLPLPEVGLRVSVWHDEHGDPRAMIARLQGKRSLVILDDEYNLSMCVARTTPAASITASRA